MPSSVCIIRPLKGAGLLDYQLFREFFWWGRVRGRMPGTVSKYSSIEKQDLDGRKRKAGLTLEEITLPRIKNTKTQGNYASYDI